MYFQITKTVHKSSFHSFQLTPVASESIRLKLKTDIITVLNCLEFDVQNSRKIIPRGKGRGFCRKQFHTFSIKSYKDQTHAR